MGKTLTRRSRFHEGASELEVTLTGASLLIAKDNTAFVSMTNGGSALFEQMKTMPSKLKL